MQQDDERLSFDQDITRGERVARSAAMIGDQDDFHVWRLQRRAWVENAAWAILRGDPGQAAVSEFRRAMRVQAPHVEWQLQLAEEVNCLRAGIAVLRALSESRVER